MADQKENRWTTEDEDAVLLLAARLPGQGGPNPLSPTHYDQFARALHSAGYRPSDLLRADRDTLISSLDGVKDDILSRVSTLLDRGGALALAKVDWKQGGVWCLTRGSPSYPQRLRTRLKRNMPPVLFGVGDVSLFSKGGVAIVGSRDVDDAGREFARELGTRLAAKGAVVISGGAKGVDSEAMMAALDEGGEAVGVLSQGVKRLARSKDFHDAWRDQRLVLAAAVVPEARFHVGTAMARNKYLYALADFAVVVSSGEEGGTWSGAIEDLRNGWCPLFVREGEGIPMGNKALLAKGANPLPQPDPELLKSTTAPPRQLDLFDESS